MTAVPESAARLSPEREAEIAARAEAATPGPWGFYDGDNYADVAADLQVTGRGSYSYREKVARLEDENYWDDAAHEDDDEEQASEQMVTNAAFIAHAREDVPALLAELAAVRAERDQARERIAELEAERHTTNEALSDAAEQLRRDRDRIAELEHPSTGSDTLAAWLFQRFYLGSEPWERLDEDNRSYWEHEARAVRRAVARGGYKTEEPVR